MLTLKCVTKTRAFLSPLLIINKTLISSSYSSSTTHPFFLSKTTTVKGIGNLHAKDVVLSFKEWFKCRNNALLDQIFEILSSRDEDDSSFSGSADLALSQLGLRLSEEFVLEVLNYGKDVLPCLKFFDWVGRQPGFHHTRATFNAIFKILSRAELMSLMLDFLENYMKQRYAHKVRFYDTLVMGYAVAGKPDIALQLFGKMRFQGLDLDGFSFSGFYPDHKYCFEEKLLFILTL